MIEQSTGRRILLVSYFYPPMNIIGARRPYALGKWLQRRGHDVTVLTSAVAGSDSRGPQSVIYSRDLLASRLNWRRTRLEVVTGQRPGSWSPGPGFWGSIIVPDVQLVSWMPFALAEALRLHRSRAFDVVVSTSPVESAHGIGFALSRVGVPWIADLRDGWRFEAPREDWRLALQRKLDDGFERLVVTAADAVVTVSEPLTVDLTRRYGVSAVTITNGFDPDETGPSGAGDGPLTPGKLSLVYTGGLGKERTLAPLLKALRRLSVDDPSLPARVEVVVAGNQTEEERALYARADVAPFVRHLGFIPRAEALSLQRLADVLLLVTSGVRTGEATGKLYEYLAASRPILVLGAESAAADIVRQERVGTVIPLHDPQAVEAALRKLLDGVQPELRSTTRAHYGYPALTERYEMVIERAIARRHGRSPRSIENGSRRRRRPGDDEVGGGSKELRGPSREVTFRCARSCGGGQT